MSAPQTQQQKPAATAAKADDKSNGKAKKARKPREAGGGKSIFLLIGSPGAVTVKKFSLAKSDKTNEKGEPIFVAAKKQANEFINSPECPTGGIVIVEGVEKRTKQRL